MEPISVAQKYGFQKPEANPVQGGIVPGVPSFEVPRQEILDTFAEIESLKVLPVQELIPEELQQATPHDPHELYRTFQYNPEHIPFDTKPEYIGHWFGFLRSAKSISGYSEMRVAKNRAMLTYVNGGESFGTLLNSEEPVSKTHLVVSLDPNISDYRGLKIEKLIQERIEDAQAVDILAGIPDELDIRFSNQALSFQILGWYVPSWLNNLLAKKEQRIEDIGIGTANDRIAEILYHEYSHYKDDKKVREDTLGSGLRSVSHRFMGRICDSSIWLTPLAIVAFGNPILAIAPLAINIVGYMLLKTKGNIYNSGFLSELQSENQAFLSGNILNEYLYRNGLLPKSIRSKWLVNPDGSILDPMDLRRYALGLPAYYAPFAFARIIDKTLYRLSMKRYERNASKAKGALLKEGRKLLASQSLSLATLS